MQPAAPSVDDLVKQLRVSEARYRALVQNLADVVTIIAPDGTILYESPSVTAIFGFTPEELIGKRAFDFVHPEDVVAATMTLTKAVAAPNETHKTEVRFKHKDGSWRTIEASGRVFLDETGGPRALIISRDISNRKKMETALRESEQRFRRMVEIASEGIWMIDSEGKTLFVNKRVGDILGRAVDEIVGKTPFDFLDETNKQILKERLIHRRQGLSEQYEITFLRKDGSSTPAIVSASPLTDERGAYEGAVAFITDVREKNALTAKISQLSQAVEQSPMCVVITDKGGAIQYVNPAFTQTTGYAREEAIGKTPRILKSGEQAKAFYEELWTKILGGDVWRGEFHNKKKNGELYWEYAAIAPIKDEQGNITNFVALKENVTDRKQMEADLAKAGEHMNKVMNAISDPIFVKDRKHLWVLMNDAMCAFIGHARAELIGKSDYDFFPKEQADVFWAKDEEVFASGKENVNEEKFTDAAGIVHTIVTKKTLYTDGNGDVFIVGAIRDVSEQKKAEADLIARTQELERMNALMIGRELKMAELKKEVERLKR